MSVLDSLHHIKLPLGAMDPQVGDTTNEGRTMMIPKLGDHLDDVATQFVERLRQVSGAEFLIGLAPKEYPNIPGKDRRIRVVWIPKEGVACINDVVFKRSFADLAISTEFRTQGRTWFFTKDRWSLTKEILLSIVLFPLLIIVVPVFLWQLFYRNLIRRGVLFLYAEHMQSYLNDFRKSSGVFSTRIEHCLSSTLFEDYGVDARGVFGSQHY